MTWWCRRASVAGCGSPSSSRTTVTWRSGRPPRPTWPRSWRFSGSGTSSPAAWPDSTAEAGCCWSPGSTAGRLATCSLTTARPRSRRSAGTSPACPGAVTVARYARPVMTETDLVLGDGRTLHVYDIAPGEADARLAVFWHHGTPNLGAPPEPLLPGRPSMASAGCRMTGLGTAARLRSREGTWRRWRPTSPASPTPLASGGSRCLAIPAEPTTPWPAARCCASGCWAWSAWPGWRRSRLRGSTGSRAWQPVARPSCAPPPPDARRWRTIWPPPRSTLSSSPRTIGPPSPVRGPGWAMSPNRPWRAAWADGG